MELQESKDILEIFYNDDESKCYFCNEPFVHKRLLIPYYVKSIDCVMTSVHLFSNCSTCEKLFQRINRLERDILNTQWTLFLRGALK